MNEMLSKIGLCSILITITYIIKKINEYLYLKKEESQNYKIDEDYGDE